MVRRLSIVTAPRVLLSPAQSDMRGSLVADCVLFRSFGTVEAASTVLKRAAVAKCDDPYRIFAAWLQLEREEQDLERYHSLCHKRIYQPR